MHKVGQAADMLLRLLLASHQKNMAVQPYAGALLLTAGVC